LVDAPQNWRSIQMQSTFNPRVFNQANLQTDEFIFVNQAAKTIIAELDSTFGVAQAIPIEIQMVDGDTLEIFKGFIDTANDFEIVSPVKVKCKLFTISSIDQLNQRLASITWDLLWSRGDVVKADFVNVELIRCKTDITNDVIQLGIMIYIFQNEFQTYIDKINEARWAWQDLDPFNPATIGSAVEKTLIALLYIGVGFIKLRALYIIFGRIIPTGMNRSAITFKRGLEIIYKTVGLTFNTSIEDLDKFIFVPTHRLDEDIKKAGIPSSNDSGYILSDFIKIATDLTNARVQIINGVVQMHSEDSNFWGSSDLYNMADVLAENFSYNVDDLPSTFILSYTPDISDEWTISKYLGTAFEVSYTPLRNRDERSNLIKGFKEIRLPMAKANHFVDNNGFISLLIDVYTNINNLFGLFGGTGLKLITKPADATIICSNQFFSVPKLAYKNATKRNEYEKTSARAIYNKFYHGLEFSQRKLFKGNRVPFKLNDWQKIVKNSTFVLADGTNAEMRSINWEVANDVATPEYYVNSPYLKENIQRIEHEPQ
jgi:hypothetical protein